MAGNGRWALWLGIALLVVVLASGTGMFWMLFGMWFAWWGLALFMLPFLLIVGAIIGVGYLAYRARVAREEAPVQELVNQPDPADELERVNDEIEELAKESARLLEQTRETMERGLRG